MGWVVEGFSRDLAGKLGTYRANDWSRFLEDCGLLHIYADLPASLPAFFLGRAIVLRRDMDPERTAWWAWHEALHALLHVGNREEWRRLVCGDLILSKFERQADEFAEVFPDWDAAETE